MIKDLFVRGAYLAVILVILVLPNSVYTAIVPGLDILPVTGNLEFTAEKYSEDEGNIGVLSGSKADRKAHLFEISPDSRPAQKLFTSITEKRKSDFVTSYHSDQQIIHDYVASASRLAKVVLNQDVIIPDFLSAGDRLLVEVSPGRYYDVIVDTVAVDHAEKIVQGQVKGSNLGFFHLTVSADQTMVVLRIPEENLVYHITYNKSGYYNLFELRIDQFEQYESLPPRIPEEHDSSVVREQDMDGHVTMASDFTSAGNPHEPANIDVMVVYTPAARNWAGGSAGMNNVINHAMLRAQDANDNSKTGITMNLVHTAEVNYTESGSLGTDLHNITFGSISNVHSLRDTYGADLVAFFPYYGTGSGQAWLYMFDAEKYGYSVSCASVVANTYLAVHEIGHNLGAHHHKQQNSQPGPNSSFPYAAGWRFDINGQWYNTIMSYSNGSYYDVPAPGAGISSIEVGYFSTPDVFYPGSITPVGHYDDGDNARMLRESKHIVANYRSSSDISLSFTALNPTSIETSTRPYDTELTAMGSNFNNLASITFSWGGASSGGSVTWAKGSSDWNEKVEVLSDTEMILNPRVVSSIANWSGTDTWTVELQDNTGATRSRHFTVTFNFDNPEEPTLFWQDENGVVMYSSYNDPLNKKVLTDLNNGNLKAVHEVSGQTVLFWREEGASHYTIIDDDFSIEEEGNLTFGGEAHEDNEFRMEAVFEMGGETIIFWRGTRGENEGRSAYWKMDENFDTPGGAYTGFFTYTGQEHIDPDWELEAVHQHGGETIFYWRGIQGKGLDNGDSITAFWRLGDDYNVESPGHSGFITYDKGIHRDSDWTLQTAYNVNGKLRLFWQRLSDQNLVYWEMEDWQNANDNQIFAKPDLWLVDIQ